MSDFTTGATITATPAEAFAAILDTRSWWNEAIEGSTAAVGDEFGFEVQGLHRTRMRVTDTTPNRRVEWLVLDNEFGFIRDQNEWVGDRIVFEIEPADGGSHVTFTQHGLVPELECYEVCSNAWVFFIQDSLRKLAEHGKGSPETNAGQAAPAARARDAVAALDREEHTVSNALSCGYVLYVHSSPARVWRALTDAEETAAWWGRSNVSDWQVGSTWEHHKDSPSGELDGTGVVLESIPSARLAFTFPSGDPSKVEIDIEPYQDIVRITLTHSELASEQLRSVVAAVWAAVLSNLKTYLETGTPLPQSPVGMLGLS